MTPKETQDKIRALPPTTSHKEAAKLVGVDEKTVRKYRSRAESSPAPAASPTAPPAPAPSASPRLAAALVAAGEGVPAAAPGLQADPHVLPPGVNPEAVAEEVVALFDTITVLVVNAVAARRGAPIDDRLMADLPLTEGEKMAMKSAAVRGAPVLYKLCGGATISAGMFFLLGFGFVQARIRKLPPGKAKETKSIVPPVPEKKTSESAPTPVNGAPKSPDFRAISEEERAALSAKAAAAHGIRF